MKINLKSNIKSIDASSTNEIILAIKSHEGTVETKLVTAKEAGLEGTLTLKRVMGQDIKIGSIIKIEITIEDQKETL